MDAASHFITDLDRVDAHAVRPIVDSRAGSTPRKPASRS
jgi:hypothetical protein